MLFMAEGCILKNVLLTIKTTLEIRKFIEDKSAQTERKPYQSLLFNNTVIKKSASKIKFDTNSKKYGHDDTQLAFEISLLKCKVNQNPVEHGDIDTNLVYLNKTKASLRI
jgi:hypothetical protein